MAQVHNKYSMGSKLNHVFKGTSTIMCKFTHLKKKKKKKGEKHTHFMSVNFVFIMLKLKLFESSANTTDQWQYNNLLVAQVPWSGMEQNVAGGAITVDQEEYHCF